MARPPPMDKDVQKTALKAYERGTRRQRSDPPISSPEMDAAREATKDGPRTMVMSSSNALYPSLSPILRWNTVLKSRPRRSTRTTGLRQSTRPQPARRRPTSALPPAHSTCMSARSGSRSSLTPRTASQAAVSGQWPHAQEAAARLSPHHPPRTPLCHPHRTPRRAVRSHIANARLVIRAESKRSVRQAATPSSLSRR